MAQREIPFISASGNVTSVAYDDDTQELTVGFSGGSLYSYAEVPKELADEFSKSKSAGQHLNNKIKGTYKHKRLS